MASVMKGLNTSDIVYGSNVKPFFASRQILVEGDLLSGKPNCFNIFSDFLCFLLVFSQSMFIPFFELIFGLRFVLPYRFLHQHVILLA